ncbi:MAG: 16S rRNA (guanine(966)-N(2))-methyltransferase RsmD [Endomicrobiia bacterium]
MGIRIIAGKLKNREIFGIPKDKELRPILSRIKKSLFDILRPKIKGSKFLDLYAGTGSVGIEAISRGAELAVFIEINEKLVKILKKNLEKFGIDNQCEVYQRDVLLGLEWLADFKGEKFFDIIFIGPPYRDEVVSQTLSLISKANILKKTGIIIAQHHIKEKIETDKFKLIRTEKYGDSILSFFENL